MTRNIVFYHRPAPHDARIQILILLVICSMSLGKLLSKSVSFLVKWE